MEGTRTPFGAERMSGTSGPASAHARRAATGNCSDWRGSSLAERRRPRLDQALAGFEQVLREHLHISEDGHEVRVTCPTGDDVKMNVIDDAGAGDAAEVPAEIVALRAVDLTEGGHALDRQPVDLQRLLVRKPGELADVPVGGDHQMTARVGGLVQHHKREPAAEE